MKFQVWGGKVYRMQQLASLRFSAARPALLGFDGMAQHHSKTFISSKHQRHKPPSLYMLMAGR